MDRDDLTSKQLDYAVFLPAISGFYATFIGKQRVDPNYVDPNRMPAAIGDMEELNWLNSQQSLFPYKWSLYSGGHANLDLNKIDPSEDMVRDREAGTFMLGDSGGFQIAKGLWEGEWRDPTSVAVQSKLAQLTAQGVEIRPVLTKAGKPKLDKNGHPKTVTIDPVKNYQKLLDAAQKKRELVLTWLDNISDYGMILDIPTWVIHDKKASKACGITTLAEAVDATKFNNDYFMANRKGKNNGGAKYLNVLQGDTHSSADTWYHTMKDYCDPAIYPDTHFDGWAMGGQNMCDVHLVLMRLVALRHDNLLQEGVHDWMHFLGTSKLEWAVLLTVIQRAVRKYVNPNFTISFDCASPFLATANGQVYHHVDLPHNKKWCYRMSPSIDDKKYATDTRMWRDVAMTDYVAHFKHFDESPVSARCQVKDICIYNDGVRKTPAELNGVEFDVTNLDHYSVAPDVNKINKVGKTSWDSFSYALQMGHNVWTHIHAVQEANRRFDAGEYPKMLRRSTGDTVRFIDVVESIFATSSRQESEDIIKYYEYYWMEIIGTRGFKGKKVVNSRTSFDAHMEFADNSNDDSNNDGVSEDEIDFNQANLDNLNLGLK